MKLLTKELRRKLPPLYSQETVKDPMIICKFFTPDAGWIWYVIEFDGTDTFLGMLLVYILNLAILVSQNYNRYGESLVSQLSGICILNPADYLKSKGSEKQQRKLFPVRVPDNRGLNRGGNLAYRHKCRK